MTRAVLTLFVTLMACGATRERVVNDTPRAVDPCADLPVSVAEPAPRIPGISLALLGDMERARERVAEGPPLELGVVSRRVRLGRSHISGNLLGPVFLARPRFPLDEREAGFPEEVRAVLRAHRDATLALREVMPLRRTSPRADACVEARRTAVDAATEALRQALSPRSEPLANLLLAELAMTEHLTLEDAHLSDLALDEAVTRSARARDATRPEELVGFFARLLFIEASRGGGGDAHDAALAEARALVAIEAPAAILQGEAAFRAAELESSPLLRMSTRFCSHIDLRGGARSSRGCPRVEFRSWQSRWPRRQTGAVIARSRET